MGNERDESADDAGPLSDISVLDLTRMLAGPFATMILADLGADVVKIESPDGDSTRGNRPRLEGNDVSYGGYFQSVNRNKRSIVLDLKKDDGKAAFEQLVADSDVVVENFREGVMGRLGLSYESLQEINPELVYASIRGFGSPEFGESPHAERPAYDIIAQAMGGIMSITGSDETGPVKVGPGVGDIFPAVLTAVAILSAVHHRERTGEGQRVDVGMVDAILSLCERIVHQYSYTNEVPKFHGNSHPLLFPFGRFEAADGFVVIAAPLEHMWKALCEHMDRLDLYEKYPKRNDRLGIADELRPAVNEWTRQHTKQELFDMLADDVPCGQVYTAEDIFDDPHFYAREMLVDVEHANTGETVKIAGPPIKLSRTPSAVRHRAPLLGEHTQEILREGGLTEETVEALIENGSVLVNEE